MLICSVSFCTLEAKKLDNAERTRQGGDLPLNLPTRDKTQHFPVQPELPVQQQLFILVAESNGTHEQMLINEDVPGLPLGKALFLRMPA